MKVTKKEAKSIAERILSNNFGVYGLGNFDLSVGEFARVLEIAINVDEGEEAEVDSVLTEYFQSIK